MIQFNSISRFKRDFQWSPESTILISEKLDGANASIRFKTDEQGKLQEFSCFSRRNELSEDLDLRGFYSYANEVLLPRLQNDPSLPRGVEMIIYGEWLVKHTIAYKEGSYNKFYPFAVFSVDDDKYMNERYVSSFAAVLGLNTPKTLYYGKLKDITVKQIQDFVGRSPIALDPQGGEGVVVWNADSEDNSNCRIKFVSSAFSEKSKAREHKIYDATETEKWIGQFITDARVTKALHKLNDEQVLPKISFTNFGDISRPTLNYVYDDILKEESDSLPELFDEKEARKRIGKIGPVYIRKFIEEFGV